ncbi:RNA polymerase ECF family sigma subunit [Stackebrandtia endophytica]|uniref:RNA polymerase ECF family sigma subunit n=1 Tax=Stackebrandtia endophytica TaxID=1496996 RepID=A0A543ASP6_9ACTN|nr:sigma-70 family RNA polymerase sigma factor [Stackebrandtia endophytica]TQL75611.1 RNA polymerase ECF family sigma subunit [Stackebrandtia endophytica]
MTDIAAAVARAHREFGVGIVATLIRITGDWTLAEDCAQDAVAAALERWPRDGVPRNPAGWLVTVARNRAIDHIRRAATERERLRELAVIDDLTGWADLADAVDGRTGIEDDRLRLIFTCCHPALSQEAQVALTLRTIAGVATGDIARAFLVTESTMTRRITRAKTKIAAAGIPFKVPSGPLLPERVPGVLSVLYLLFTQGYRADGEPAFAREAIRVARLLAALMPDEPEAVALLALMLLQDSRRRARRDDAGALVTLNRQDRSRWDHAAIAEGLALVDRLGDDGPYTLQAQIAACHARAASAEQTDWRAIAERYDRLWDLTASPVVALNRAVAHGFAFGPTVGLRRLDELDDRLAEHPARTAATAEFLAGSGRIAEAVAAFLVAAEATVSESERQALRRRAEELGGTVDGP